MLAEGDSGFKILADEESTDDEPETELVTGTGDEFSDKSDEVELVDAAPESRFDVDSDKLAEESIEEEAGTGLGTKVVGAFVPLDEDDELILDDFSNNALALGTEVTGV